MNTNESSIDSFHAGSEYVQSTSDQALLNELAGSENVAKTLSLALLVTNDVTQKSVSKSTFY